MLLRVELIGSGTDTDPWRASLPTYSMLEVDYAAATCIVEVDPRDLPTDLPRPRAADEIVTDRGRARIHLPAATIARWHALLDDRYREHAGEFRPQPR